MQSRGTYLGIKADIITRIDPTTTALEGAKGTICRYVPSVGVPQLFIKQDDGETTSWNPVGGSFTGVPYAVSYFDNTGNPTSSANFVVKGQNTLISILGDGTETITPGLNGRIVGNFNTGSFSSVNGTANEARGYATNGASLNSLANASTAIGAVVGDGVEVSIITAEGEGSFARGVVNNPGVTSAIKALGIASLATGLNQGGTIQVNGSGSEASGYVSSLAQIMVFGNGSKGFGIASGNNANDSKIEVYGDGAYGGGSVGTTGVNSYIRSNGSGSYAHGFALDSIVMATGDGSVAHGYSQQNSTINAAGPGSMVAGFANFGSTVVAVASGASAFGYADSVGTVSAAGSGSHVTGYAVGKAINATGTGATAGGNASGGNITSTSKGSRAFGYAQSADIHATDEGAYAGGRASTGPVVAAHYGVFAHGDEIILSHQHSVAFGRGHSSLANYQAIFGSYSNLTANHLFVVGNGISNAVRSNAFEVQNNGVYKFDGAKIYKLKRVDADYNITYADPMIVVVPAIDNTYNLNMPPGVDGMVIRLQNLSGSFNQNIVGDGSETVNGSAVDNLAAGTCIELMFDANTANWNTISSN